MSQQKKLLLLLLLGVLAWWLWQDHNQQPPPEPVNPAPKQPVPAPAPPKKPDEPKKPRLPKPWGPHADVRSDVTPVSPDVESPGKPVEGGKKSPDGAVELVCDLPEKERKKNIASKGLGCCVFRSMEYCGRFQNEKELYDLPERMVQKGTPGGGYPEKLTKIMQEYAPDVQWGQDTSGDPAVLEAVLKSGRPAGVTYDGRDGVHYSGSIAHMVQCVYYDRGTGWAAISDNNFIKDNQYVWMSCDEFNKRWKGGGGGWVAFLLASPPPVPPHN